MALLAAARRWFSSLLDDASKRLDPRGYGKFDEFNESDTGNLYKVLIDPATGEQVWRLIWPQGGAAAVLSGDVVGPVGANTFNPTTRPAGVLGATDAAAAGVTNVETLRHLLAGGAGAAQGFGVGLLASGPDEGGSVQPYGQVSARLDTRSGSFAFSWYFSLGFGPAGGAALQDVAQLTPVGELRIGPPPGSGRHSALSPALTTSGVTVSELASYGIVNGAGVRQIVVVLNGTVVQVGDGATDTGVTLSASGPVTDAIPGAVGVNAASLGGVGWRGGAGTGTGPAGKTTAGGSMPTAAGAGAQPTGDSFTAWGTLVNLTAAQGNQRTPVADADHAATLAEYRIAYTALTAARVIAGPVTDAAHLPAGAVVEYVVADESGAASATNTLAFTPSSGTINGAASLVVVNKPFGQSRVYFDGTNWHCDLAGLAPAQGVVQVIRFAIGATGTYNSLTPIPANARVLQTTVEATTPYPSGATITVGQPGNLTLLQADNENTPSDPLVNGQPNLFIKDQDVGWGVAAAVVRATVAGAASGAGFVIVEYALPNP